MNNFIIAISLFSMVILMMGIFIGILFERAKWNKLIDQGIIPKPRQKN